MPLLRVAGHCRASVYRGDQATRLAGYCNFTAWVCEHKCEGACALSQNERKFRSQPLTVSLYCLLSIWSSSALCSREVTSQTAKVSQGIRVWLQERCRTHTICGWKVYTRAVSEAVLELPHGHTHPHTHHKRLQDSRGLGLRISDTLQQ